MGGKAIMPDVVTFMAARPDVPVTLQQLATALGVEGVRIQKALSTAISSGAYGDTLQCLHRGQVWSWRGNGKPTPQPVNPGPPEPVAVPEPPASPQGLRKGDVVEVMGTTGTGDAVASDGDGRLYRMVPL